MTMILLALHTLYLLEAGGERHLIRNDTYTSASGARGGEGGEKSIAEEGRGGRSLGL